MNNKEFVFNMLKLFKRIRKVNANQITLYILKKAFKSCSFKLPENEDIEKIFMYCFFDEHIDKYLYQLFENVEIKKEQIKAFALVFQDLIMNTSTLILLDNEKDYLCEEIRKLFLLQCSP